MLIHSGSPITTPQITATRPPPARDGIPQFLRGTVTPYFLQPNSSAAPIIDQMPDRSSFDWASRIRRCSHDARPHDALSMFREITGDHHRRPSEPALSAVLTCCASLRAVRSGQEVHGFMVRNTGAETTARCSESALMNFYAKCGFISAAQKVFDRMPHRDVVTWTIMLMAYADAKGFEGELMALLQEMLSSSVAPNCHTFTVVLRRVTLKQGEQLHAHIMKRGWASDAFVGSSLVDFYARNGIWGCVHLVFDRIEHKDVVCYNSLISGYYGRIGNTEGLISVYKEMGLVGLVSNQSTIVGLLNGVANSGSMVLSKQFHTLAILRGFGFDGVVQGVVVDMYAKCGNLAAARAVFDRMIDDKSVVAWNSIICGYGKHGCGDEALRAFDSMELARIPPDHITFTCLLSACSHSGLVDEGCRLFKLMSEVYRIPARDEHYCCMVDLLGRAGMVRVAYEFICRCNCEFGASVWGALLAACRVWGEAEIGEVAARMLFELEPKCSGSYVALASIFAENKRWGDASAVRELMGIQGIRKDPGYSWIEIGGVVNKFRAGEEVDYPGMEEVHDLCNRLNSCICDSPCPEIIDVSEDFYLQE